MHIYNQLHCTHANELPVSSYSHFSLPAQLCFELVQHSAADSTGHNNTTKLTTNAMRNTLLFA